MLRSNHHLLIPSPGSGSLPNAPTKSKGLKNRTCPPRTVVIQCRQAPTSASSENATWPQDSSAPGMVVKIRKEANEGQNQAPHGCWSHSGSIRMKVQTVVHQPFPAHPGGDNGHTCEIWTTVLRGFHIQDARALLCGRGHPLTRGDSKMKEPVPAFTGRR